MISGKVDLVQSNLCKLEIIGIINLGLKVKWCWCNPPLMRSASKNLQGANWFAYMHDVVDVGRSWQRSRVETMLK